MADQTLEKFDMRDEEEVIRYQKEGDCPPALYTYNYGDQRVTISSQAARAILRQQDRLGYVHTGRDPDRYRIKHNWNEWLASKDLLDATRDSDAGKAVETAIKAYLERYSQKMEEVQAVSMSEDGKFDVREKFEKPRGGEGFLVSVAIWALE